MGDDDPEGLPEEGKGRREHLALAVPFFVSTYRYRPAREPGKPGLSRCDAQPETAGRGQLRAVTPCSLQGRLWRMILLKDASLRKPSASLSELRSLPLHLPLWLLSAGP